MSSRVAIALLLIAMACACGNSQTLSSAASQPRLTSPMPSDADFVTYSGNRFAFRYPNSWRLLDLWSGRSVTLFTPDYRDSGGVQITTIQQGATIVVSQTDIPQKDVTAENYGSNRILFPSDATDAKVIVINGRKTFQYRTSVAPWFDITQTLFFRDDGTRVDVAIQYPRGHDVAHAQDYAQLLASVAIR